MNPATIQRLRENVPELRELCAFLASEAAKLNTLDGLDELPPDQRAIEASGRIHAHRAVTAILAPLIEGVDKPAAFDPREYMV